MPLGDTVPLEDTMPEYPAVPAPLRVVWDELLAPTPDPAPYRPELAAHLPTPVRRWLEHAVAPGTPLRRRIEMWQRGRIRLNGRWWPIRSRQALDPLRGYVWPVRTSMFGLPLLGVDRLSDGTAEMNHRLLGLLPVVTATGPDLVRSAAARAATEMCWSPATALHPSVRWRELSADAAIAEVPVAGEVIECTLRFGPDGSLRSATAPRWAQLGDGPWQWHTFGARVLEEGSFGGFTVPRRVVAGYGDDIAGEGAFIRLVVDDAVAH